jgi:peptide deformylase
MNKLVLAPNKILNTPVAPLDLSRNDIPEIAYELKMLMHFYNGLGLSANQINLNAQIFAMKTFLNKKWGNDLIVINPMVLSVSNETFIEPEGCLSYPDLILNIKRPYSCEVEFYTLINNYTELTKIQTTFKDIDARIFLHEFDHLLGIEFVDRVGKTKLQLALKRKLKKEKK